MPASLISLSADLTRLREDGYEVEIVATTSSSNVPT
jgi:hypothetical protein